MKGFSSVQRVLVLAIMCLWAGFAAIAQSPGSIPGAAKELSAIDELTAAKRYLGAIEGANALDASRFGPEKIWYQVEVSTKYFVVSLNHRMFGFKDIGKDENIEDFRGQNGEYTLVNGDLEADLTAALKAYPDNPLVKEAAGTYYLDLYRRYEGKAGHTPEELFDLITSHYLAAADLGRKNQRVCANLGETYLQAGRWQETLAWYEPAIAFDGANPTYQYNSAYALIELGRLPEAEAYARRATELYTEAWYLADSHMMLGYILQQSGRFDECVASFKRAIEIDPELDYPYVQIIGTYLHTGQNEKADELALWFIGRRLEYFDTLQTLLNFYAGYDRAQAAVGILNELLPLQEGNPFNTGSVLLHRGYLLGMEEPTLAVPDYRAALDCFNESLGPEHNLCVTLSQMLANIEGGEKPAPAAATP